jgi:hypothetical protein
MSSYTESYVYLIQDGRAVKIGVARYPDNRLSLLQIGNPRQLRLIHQESMETHELALKVEAQLHHKCRRLNIRGEWFRQEAIAIARNYFSARNEWPDASRVGGVVVDGKHYSSQYVKKHGVPWDEATMVRCIERMLSDPDIRKDFPTDQAISAHTGIFIGLVAVVRMQWEARQCREATA